MACIFETQNFIVESHEQPFVSRTDGGHIRIRIKDESIEDRTQLSAETAIELMRLTMIVGQALEQGMNEQGISVVKINYQDMGNWAFKTGKRPYLHIHIFGRTFDAKHQIFPESVYLPARESGFYDSFEPLNSDDIRIIRSKIEILEKTKQYQDPLWHLPHNE